MGNELRLCLDQHQMDRLEAIFLLHQELFPASPLKREELFQRILEKGLRNCLQELLTNPDERPPGRRNARERLAA